MGGIGFGPIGIAITAITALSAAGVALFEGWKNAYKDASPFTEALEDIKTKNDELQTSISNTKTNYENATTASEANAAAAQGLYGHLQNLIAGYDGTSAKAAGHHRARRRSVGDALRLHHHGSEGPRRTVRLCCDGSLCGRLFR